MWKLDCDCALISELGRLSFNLPCQHIVGNLSNQHGHNDGQRIVPNSLAVYWCVPSSRQCDLFATLYTNWALLNPQADWTSFLLQFTTTWMSYFGTSFDRGDSFARSRAIAGATCCNHLSVSVSSQVSRSFRHLSRPLLLSPSQSQSHFHYNFLNLNSILIHIVIMLIFMPHTPITCLHRLRFRPHPHPRLHLHSTTDSNGHRSAELVVVLANDEI